jgi:hypothetical protein
MIDLVFHNFVLLCTYENTIHFDVVFLQPSQYSDMKNTINNKSCLWFNLYVNKDLCWMGTMVLESPYALCYENHIGTPYWPDGYMSLNKSIKCEGEAVTPIGHILFKWDVAQHFYILLIQDVSER